MARLPFCIRWLRSAQDERQSKPSRPTETTRQTGVVVVSSQPTKLKVGKHDGTSPCDWSLRLVSSCELAIFASKSSRRDQIWSLRLVPRIQTSLNFWDKSLRLILQNASCEPFVGPVRSCDQSRRVNSSGDQLQGLVAGTNPLVCADLKRNARVALASCNTLI